MLTPTESLRAALLCSRETVPQLRNSLALCERLRRADAAAFSVKLKARDQIIENASPTNPILAITGYVLIGVAFGVSISIIGGK